MDAKTNPWTVDYSKLTPLLVKGMQDQQLIIDQQQVENENLKQRISQLEEQVSKINELEGKFEALLNTSNEIKTK